MHNYYQRLIKAERLAAIGEVAVTIRHEVNNALAAIVGEAGLLRAGANRFSPEDRAGVETILEMANRIGADLKKLSTLDDAPITNYIGQEMMVNLNATRKPEGA